MPQFIAIKANARVWSVQLKSVERALKACVESSNSQLDLEGSLSNKARVL